MSRIEGRLHTETYGEGPSVVWVHGWGMHAGVWRDFALSLARAFQVVLVDLPGHGRSGMIPDFSLPGVVRSLFAVAPPKAHWLGWSLGAEISLAFASMHPDRVSSLAMMAGSARFVRGADWVGGMETGVMDRFAAGMMEDYHATLMKFLSLQTWGLDDARAVLKALRARVGECEEPDKEALRAGLEILRHADLRPQLASLRVPLLMLLGGRDRLAPPAVGVAMRELAPDAELHVLDRAAHVPFLTHPGRCADILSDFWIRHG
jgi:pimeloyl-[acyl-carrier protein] methyl ester esterase